MGGIACVPGVNKRCIDTLGQAYLAINATRQHRPKVRRLTPPSKIVTNGMAWAGGLRVHAAAQLKYSR
jgi:hypothetical protein